MRPELVVCLPVRIRLNLPCKTGSGLGGKRIWTPPDTQATSTQPPDPREITGIEDVWNAWTVLYWYCHSPSLCLLLAAGPLSSSPPRGFLVIIAGHLRRHQESAHLVFLTLLHYILCIRNPHLLLFPIHRAGTDEPANERTKSVSQGISKFWILSRSRLLPQFPLLAVSSLSFA